MPAWVERWLGVRRAEFRRTLGMFLYLMLAVGAFVTARIARDALFLSRYDISYLPYMYVWVALGVASLSYVYSHFADRFRRDHLVQVVTAILFCGVVAARIVLDQVGDWFLPVLYVFVEVMGGLLTIQFWTFANDVYTTREAKRLFGLVGAGGVAATITLGFAVGGLAEWVGTANLLWLTAGLLVGCLAMVTSLGHSCRRELTMALAGAPSARGIQLGVDLSRVFTSRHLQTIAWITILTFLAITVIDYQFKVIARYTFLNREDELSGFLGWFYGVTGVISFLLQFLATGRLLQRFGVLFSLLLLPMALAASSALLIALPGLITAAVLKGADNVLRYTVNDASTQVLYLPVPGSVRGRAKAFITGVLKPLAQGICGLALAGAGAWVGHRVDWLGIGTLLFLAGLVILVAGMKKDYIQSLVATLRQRRLHFGESRLTISDSQAVAALGQTLSDDDEHNVLHALEMIPYVLRHDWSEELGRLLAHPSEDVRLQALKLLGRENPAGHLDRLIGLLEDGTQEVRAEAITQYCAALKEKAMGAIEPLLNDEATPVRAAAVVGLIRYGGLDGIQTAAETLKAMLSSHDAAQRRAGAWTVGRVAVKTFYRSLLPLLTDPDAGVRVEAIRAAGELRSPELVLTLIHGLADARTQRSAMAALSAYGPGLLVTLRTILDNPREDKAIRLAIPEILARIGTQLGMDILASVLETGETPLRAKALDAIVHLRQRQPELRPDREMLRRLLHLELKDAYQLAAIQADTCRLEAELLTEALWERRRTTLERILKLLRLLHPGKHLEVVERNLQSSQATTRANAVELFEQVLDTETSRCFLPLIEVNDPDRLATTGDGLFPLLRRAPEAWLHELLMDDHAWTVATALDVIRRRRQTGFEGTVRLLLRHPEPLVREAAAFCLEQLSPPDRLAEAIKPLADDPHPRVRRVAAWLVPASGPATG